MDTVLRAESGEPVIKVYPPVRAIKVYEPYEPIRASNPDVLAPVNVVYAVKPVRSAWATMVIWLDATLNPSGASRIESGEPR